MKTSVLIPTINPAGNARRVINNLSREPGISIYILGDNNISSLRFSKYVCKYIYHKSNGDVDKWIAAIVNTVLENGIQIIFPIDEEGIHHLIKHKYTLKKYCDTVLLPSLDAFTLSLNKRDFADHCTTHNIKQPKYIFGENYTDNTPDDFDFPIISKDINITGGGRGIRLFYSADALNTYLESSQNKRDILLQEYVEGFDIDCSVLCDNGEIKAYTVQKGEDYGKSRFSYPIAVKFLECAEAINEAAALMKSLKWNGIAHIDLRYDANEKKYKIIEINPRYWATVDASLLAGVNFPLRHMELSMHGKSTPFNYKEIEFWSAKGFLKRFRKNPFHLLRFYFIWNSTPFRYVLKDPKPWIYKLFVRISNRIRQNKWKLQS